MKRYLKSFHFYDDPMGNALYIENIRCIFKCWTSASYFQTVFKGNSLPQKEKSFQLKSLQSGRTYFVEIAISIFTWLVSTMELKTLPYFFFSIYIPFVLCTIISPLYQKQGDFTFIVNELIKIRENIFPIHELESLIIGNFAEWRREKNTNNFNQKCIYW